MKSLKELREHNNLKQREVAKHIGVSDRVYAYYEKGRTLPAKYVKPLANLFGISCDEFLENTENPLVWEKEFGCIERTERLELPTWEEDVRKDILFSASGGIRYVFMNKIKTGYSIEKENPYIIRIQKIGECDNFIDYEHTKENYTLACRKAKELFLGEKK